MKETRENFYRLTDFRAGIVIGACVGIAVTFAIMASFF